MLEQPKTIQEALQQVKKDISIKEIQYAYRLHQLNTTESEDDKHDLIIITDCIRDVILELTNLKLLILQKCVSLE